MTGRTLSKLCSKLKIALETAAGSQQRQQPPAASASAAADYGYSAPEGSASMSGGMQRVTSVPDTPPSPFMVAQRDMVSKTSLGSDLR